MGDAITTPFDTFVFFLIFGGIPALIVLGPLVIAPWMYRRIRKLRYAQEPDDPNPDD